MTLEVVRQAIIATLLGVPGAANVKAGLPMVKSKADLDKLAPGTPLKVWFVRRVETASTSPAVGVYRDMHRWHIEGLHAIGDGSEVAFDTLIEDIRAAFRQDESLGGLVASICPPEGAGIQVEESIPVVFAGVVCHRARLVLYTEI